MIKKTIKKLIQDWGLVSGLGMIVVGIAFGLRLYNLLVLPIFADEAIYVRWAQVMRAEPTLRFLPLSDGKQPLFMWVVMGILQFFADPLIAGRVVSVLSGISSLVGVFILALVLFKSKRGALFAAFLYAISPFAVFFDRMALVDSMLAAFGIWTLVFAVLTVQTLRIDMAIFAGFVLGGAWLTKSPAIFFLLMLPLTGLVANWPKKMEAKIIHLAKLVSLWFVSFIIAFGMYNILRLGPGFQMIAIRNKDYIFSFKEVLTHPFDPFKFHLKEIVEWFLALVPWSLLLLIIGGIIVGLQKFKGRIMLLGLWILLPLFVQAEFAKVFTARYLLFTLPLLLTLAAPIGILLQRLTKKKIMWIVVVSLVFPALWIDYLLLTNPAQAPLPRVERSGYLEEWTAGTGIREIAAFIKERKFNNPQARIVIGTEGAFGTLPDGLQIYLSDLPGVTVIGVGSISISQVPPQLLGAKKAGDEAYLVVNSTRFSGDPDQLGLSMIESYPKAQRPDGTHEELLFFKLTDAAITP